MKILNGCLGYMPYGADMSSEGHFFGDEKALFWTERALFWTERALLLTEMVILVTITVERVFFGSGYFSELSESS